MPEEQQDAAAKAYDALKERIFRDEMLLNHRRPDGRAFDQVRQITIETGVLPRTHGSALFTRGETQALVTVTLGTKEDEQRIELLEPGEATKRFMLHYNFPPFSVGEVGFMRGPGRREIGHGALAERSLTALAYLFSVFRSRPSPFYVMDEVEAALDDVNLHRFLGLVAEFRSSAQLLIVSHQKRTMEAADVLYGVTMEPGGSSKVLSERVAAVLD